MLLVGPSAFNVSRASGDYVSAHRRRPHHVFRDDLCIVHYYMNQPITVWTWGTTKGGVSWDCQRRNKRRERWGHIVLVQFRGT
jgi:hypothetical protein